MMKLLDLPQDILLAIYARVMPQDLLALNQTCRILHTLGTSDYAWHQLNIDLPLDIDHKTISGNHRPFHEIRRSLMSALRVETNWKSLSTRIRGLTNIHHGDLLSGVQLLGNNWLITLSRRQAVFTTYLSAWYLSDDNGAHCAAKIEVADGSCKFAAAVRQDSNSALIALFNNSKTTGGIEVFSLALTADYLYRNTPLLPLKRIAKIVFSRKRNQDYGPLQHHGMFIEIQVNNNIVAASVAKSKELGPPLTYQIVLVNIETHAAVILEQGFPEDITTSRFTFKLFFEHIIILFSKLDRGSLFWRSTKGVMRPYTPINDVGLQGIGPIIFSIDSLPTLDLEFHPQHTSGYFAMSRDVSFTAEALSPLQSTIGVVSRFFEELWFLRLAVTPMGSDISVPASRGASPPISLEFVTGITAKAGSNIETLCLGRTGRRMVWLERSWETDEYRLMKLTFLPAGGQAKILSNALIPPHIVLPFELHTCTTMWFEEATCRICFGLHTGELYLLEL